MSKVASKRRKLGGEFKAKVAIEAIKEQRTLSELGVHFKVHPMQITTWKKRLSSEAHTLFDHGKATKSEGSEKELFEKIGRLEVENDFLQKKLGTIR
jgi:transposase